MINMPPKEMWIIDNGSRTRYYRTEKQLHNYLNKEIGNTISRKVSTAELWYIDFTSGLPQWTELPSQLWQLPNKSERQVRLNFNGGQ